MNVQVRPRSVTPSIHVWAVGFLLLSLVVTLLIPAAPSHAAEPSGGTETPSSVWETVHNPGFLDSGQDIAVDGEGNTFVLAATYHTDNDIAVLKLSPDGTLLWDVDIIGASLDFPGGIALDGAGDVWIAGWTDSADWPTVNPLQGTLIGFRDAFVTKLSADDGAILYSTFLGGDYVDEGHDIAVNAAGEIVLVGQTESSDFPTVDPIQDELNGPPYAFSDAFITRLSADGSTILYSTYLGGSDDERWTRVAIDASDAVYIAGSTESDDFPTMVPVQAANAGDSDAFVARILPDGSALDYSTYLGGEGWDIPGRIAVDGANQAYIAGTTRSFGFPTTAGAFQEQFDGADCSSPPFEYRYCNDAFLTKVTADGSSWAFSTYLGGDSDDEARGIGLDSSGKATLVGYTLASDFPGAGGNTGIYVSNLTADGGDLLYTVTKWSGSANAGHGIALDNVEDIYFTGAINVPADVYVAKLSPDSPPLDTLHVEDIQLRTRERNGRYQLRALVTIRDQNGMAVEGVEVTADVTVPPDRTRSRTALTDPLGQAVFRSASAMAGTWEVCVTNVAKPSFVYDPSQNNETCISVIFP